MFMGLSIMPDYFKQKVNLFTALAPPVFIRSIEGSSRWEAEHWDLIEFALVRVLHLYDTFTFKDEWITALNTFCDLFHDLCNHYKFMLEPAVDNMEREQVMLANMPSGASYRTFGYYAQCVVNGGQFKYYDYGKRKNQKEYGQDTPPDMPFDNIDMDIAIFYGDRDPLLSVNDIEYLIERLGSNVVYQQEIAGDHWTLGGMAADIEWFKQDLVGLLDQYNKQ